MSTHPCELHACDGCALCQLGVCCGRLAVELRAELLAGLARSHQPSLTALVAQDAGTVRGLGELVRLDALATGPGLLPRLPPALPAAVSVSLPIESRKEPVHESARVVR